MKIEIQNGDKWIKLQVLSKEADPQKFKVAHDPGESSFQFLLTKIGGLVSMRIDGTEVKRRFAMDEHPVFAEDSIAFSVVYLI